MTQPTLQTQPRKQPRITPLDPNVRARYRASHGLDTKAQKEKERIATIRRYENSQKSKAIGVSYKQDRDIFGKLLPLTDEQRKQGVVKYTSPSLSSLKGQQLDRNMAKKITSGKISTQQLKRAKSFTSDEQQKRYGGQIFKAKSTAELYGTKSERNKIKQQTRDTRKQSNIQTYSPKAKPIFMPEAAKGLSSTQLKRAKTLTEAEQRKRYDKVVYKQPTTDVESTTIKATTPFGTMSSMFGEKTPGLVGAGAISAFESGITKVEGQPSTIDKYKDLISKDIMPLAGAVDSTVPVKSEVDTTEARKIALFNSEINKYKNKPGFGDQQQKQALIREREKLVVELQKKYPGVDVNAFVGKVEGTNNEIVDVGVLTTGLSGDYNLGGANALAQGKEYYGGGTIKPYGEGGISIDSTSNIVQPTPNRLPTSEDTIKTSVKEMTTEVETLPSTESQLTIPEKIDRAVGGYLPMFGFGISAGDSKQMTKENKILDARSETPQEEWDAQDKTTAQKLAEYNEKVKALREGDKTNNSHELDVEGNKLRMEVQKNYPGANVAELIGISDTKYKQQVITDALTLEEQLGLSRYTAKELANVYNTLAPTVEDFNNKRINTNEELKIFNEWRDEKTSEIDEKRTNLNLYNQEEVLKFNTFLEVIQEEEQKKIDMLTSRTDALDKEGKSLDSDINTLNSALQSRERKFYGDYLLPAEYGGSKTVGNTKFKDTYSTISQNLKLGADIFEKVDKPLVSNLLTGVSTVSDTGAKIASKVPMIKSIGETTPEQLLKSTAVAVALLTPIPGDELLIASLGGSKFLAKAAITAVKTYKYGEIAKGAYDTGMEITHKTAPIDFKKAYNDPQWDYIKGMALGKEREKLADKGFVRNIAYGVTTAALTKEEKKTYYQKTEKELIRLGYSDSEIRNWVAALERDRVGMYFSEAAAFLIPETAAEGVGRQTVRGLLNRFKSQPAAKVLGDTFFKRAGNAFVNIFPAGVVEAGAQEMVQQKSRLLEPSVSDVVAQGVVGGAIAGTMAGAISGFEGLQKVKWNKATKMQKAGISLRKTGMVLDPYEWFGDKVMDNIERVIGRGAKRAPTVTWGASATGNAPSPTIVPDVATDVVELGEPTNIFKSSGKSEFSSNFISGKPSSVIDLAFAGSSSDSSNVIGGSSVPVEAISQQGGSTITEDREAPSLSQTETDVEAKIQNMVGITTEEDTTNMADTMVEALVQANVPVDTNVIIETPSIVEPITEVPIAVEPVTETPAEAITDVVVLTKGGFPFVPIGGAMPVTPLGGRGGGKRTSGWTVTNPIAAFGTAYLARKGKEQSAEEKLLEKLKFAEMTGVTGTFKNMGGITGTGIGLGIMTGTNAGLSNKIGQMLGKPNVNMLPTQVRQGRQQQITGNLGTTNKINQMLGKPQIMPIQKQQGVPQKVRQPRTEVMPTMRIPVERKIEKPLRQLPKNLRERIPKRLKETKRKQSSPKQIKSPKRKTVKGRI